jgi:hypothetical protein
MVMVFVISFAVLIAGIALFVMGFYFYKQKRLIQDTPTSKIRSLAMGLVEIVGRVVPLPHRVIKSPLTEKDCVYYRYTVEEYRRSGKHSHWVTIKKGERSEFFYLEDETGMVLIDPRGAKIKTIQDFECQSGFMKDPPLPVIRFLEANNLRFEGFLGANKTMRYKENYIAPNDTLYIMGTADKNQYTSDSEADKGLKDTIIQKGNHEKMFYISDKQERDILRDYSINIGGGLIVGSLLIVVGILAITIQIL